MHEAPNRRPLVLQPSVLTKRIAGLWHGNLITRTAFANGFSVLADGFVMPVMTSYLAGGKTVVGSMLGLHPEGLGLLGLKCLRIWACRTGGGGSLWQMACVSGSGGHFSFLIISFLSPYTIYHDTSSRRT